MIHARCILVSAMTEVVFKVKAINLLGEGTEGVAEGFGRQMQKSLQEHVNLQRVEALSFIWMERKGKEDRREKRKKQKKKSTKCDFYPAD